MRVFMTGATGFIGSHVAYRLIEAGHELVVMARNPQKLPELSEHPRVQRVTATLHDYSLIREGVRGCNACIHVALGWGDNPTEMLKADTMATVSLLEHCLDAGVERFIYTSSTAALGPFFSEMKESDPLMPSDYYGATKAASEAYVMAVAARSAMRCNVIRPGYTFGNPVAAGGTTQPDRRFHDIVRGVVKGEEIVLRAGDGTQFISAPDLARLYEAVLDSEVNRERYYGLGVPFVTWESIARQAIGLVGSPSSIRLIGEAEAPNLFNLEKIRTQFGFAFEPEPHLAEHLRYLVDAVSRP